MKICPAQEDDLGPMCSVHPTSGRQEGRAVIRGSVREGRAYVAVLDGRVAGYAVLEHSFFERGFISMLMVGPAHCRRGVGTALVRHVETLCESERIFTSTNQSNLPMQSLLGKLGYRYSGLVEDLDPGDPELFFSRQLR